MNNLKDTIAALKSESHGRRQLDVGKTTGKPADDLLVITDALTGAINVIVDQLEDLWRAVDLIAEAVDANAAK